MSRLFSFLLALASLCHGQDTSARLKEILDVVKAGGDDFKYLRPGNDNEPFKVECSIYILSAEPMDEKAESTKLKFYLRHSWQDSRLKSQDPSAPKLKITQDLKTLGFWTPDTFCVSCLTEKKDDGKYMAHIDENGKVLISSMIEAEVRCPLYFADYPFDSHRCIIDFESYTFKADDVSYAWKEDDYLPFGMNFEKIPPFDIVSTNYSSELFHVTTGEYSRLIAEMTLERYSAWWVLTIFVPLCNLNILSFFSYILDAEKYPGAKVCIAVGTNLVIMAFCAAINEMVPMVHYTKLIDIYTGISTTFAFFTTCAILFIVNINEDRPARKIANKVFGALAIISYSVFHIVYWTFISRTY